jgi:hypothetical protein
MNILKLIYFTYLQSIMPQRIFWGNSIDNKEVINIQKKIHREMSAAKNDLTDILLFYKPASIPASDW